MKKIFTIMLLVLLTPAMVFAAPGTKSETLKETLESEDIEYKLEDYEEEEGKVNVYLFRGQGCSHCHEFLEYVASDLAEEYGKYFNLVSYEVWNNKNNASLMQEISDYLEDDASGVPYIIIGEETFNGYAESMNAEIETAIKNLYDSEKKYDVFEEMKNNPKAKKSRKQDSSTVIVFIIFASIAVIALIVTSFKKK